MIHRMKYGIGIAVCALAVWIGWGTYNYFFDQRIPMLTITGLDENGYYAGDLTCQIATNKTGEVSIALDGQPLINNFKLNSKSQSHPFTIPTKTVNNGTHQLKIDLIDSSYHKNKTSITRNFIVDNAPLQAAFVRSDADYKVFQGRTLHLQFQANKDVKQAKIRALANTYDCFPESPKSNIYECFIPISCEETPNEYLLAVDLVDHVGNTASLENKFQIVMYPFKKQAITISPEVVKKEKEMGPSMNDLENALQTLAQKSPQEKMWRGSFCAPIDITKITCEFGTIRTTQQKGRYMHKALDVINAPRSVVWATQDGVVAMKERFSISGNTVVIDHGHGILSLFYHLDDFADIQVGQKISKGSPIGTLGKTGFATGYHLHWEMRINNIAIDPMQWTKANF